MLQRISSYLATLIPDLYAPQPTKADGPYTRLSCPEGSLIIILSAVWNAEQRPHLLHASFHPRRNAPPAIQRLQFFYDGFPEHMKMVRRKSDDKGRVASWTLETKGQKEQATYKVDADQQVFSLSFPALQRQVALDVVCTQPTPYSLLGPLGLSRIIGFILPSKWHVFSTRSKAEIRLRDADTGFVLLATQGTAHQEKNMGETFPSRWCWGQAMHPSARGSLVFAGGNVAPGLQSLFCAIRSPTGRSFTFGPASTLQIAGYGPGIRLEQDSKRGTIYMVLTDWLTGKRATIHGRADPATFLSMAAPMPEGHRSGYCFESFHADYTVSLQKLRWLRFEEIESFRMEEGAPIEFGGDWCHFGKEKVSPGSPSGAKADSARSPSPYQSSSLN